MKKLSKVFMWGMGISFLGTLPPGTLNISLMQVSIQESVLKAIFFSLGTIIAEMFYIRIALVGITWVNNRKYLFKWFELLTIIIIAALAVGSFVAATSSHNTKSIVLSNHMNRFLLGALLSAISPMHLPFWFGWSTMLLTKGILIPEKLNYIIYIIGISVGTFVANCIFIFGGKLIVDKLNTNQNTLNWIIGIVFSITALIQLFRFIKAHRGKISQKEPVTE